jgi:hypothetical protein
MRLRFRAPRRASRATPGDPDPSVQVVHDAIAFAAAAIDGESSQVRAIVAEALATDPDGFIDALATTMAMLAEEAQDHGADVRTALREVALGIHLAAIAEATHDHPEG